MDDDIDNDKTVELDVEDDDNEDSDDDFENYEEVQLGMA